MEHAAAENVLIGFVERFDESMVLFENTLQDYIGGLRMEYVKQNQNPAKPVDAMPHLCLQLGDDLFSDLLDKNDFDTSLYRLLSVDFDNRIKKIGNFAQRLVEFRQRCSRLG